MKLENSAARFHQPPRACGGCLARASSLSVRASVIAGIPWFLIVFLMAAERSKTSGYGALFMWGKSVVCHDWKSDGIRQVFKVVLEAWQIRDAP